jgi:hypothetical protein
MLLKQTTLNMIGFREIKLQKNFGVALNLSAICKINWKMLTIKRISQTPSFENSFNAASFTGNWRSRFVE